MYTRRHLLKTLFLGGAALGLPACGALRRPGPREARPSTQLGGESYLVCHGVRDGSTPGDAPITGTHDVVIVGGGPSGLAAALRLSGRDVLLLEKEPHFGGNALLDEWQGLRLSTGAAFYSSDETELIHFLEELGLRGSPVVGGDALVIHGQPTGGFFNEGADRLPLPRRAREDFKRTREVLQGVLASRSQAELDAMRFSEVLAPLDDTVRRFWDRFGASTWGADSEQTSALVGCAAGVWVAGAEASRLTFEGGLGAVSHHLARVLEQRLGERMRPGAAVYRMEPEPKGGIVRYVEQGEPRAVRARVIIVAAAKFHASHLVAGLPGEQVAAMRAMRYAPYLVLNVCLSSPGPEPAFDNWFLDAPFADFIPADWVRHAGRGPRDRRTALTVYHPLPEPERGALLSDARVLDMADDVAGALERHFPGTLERIVELRVYRRGHPMYMPSPGRLALFRRAAEPFGPVLFANTDSGAVISSFATAVRAGERAAEQARALLAT